MNLNVVTGNVGGVHPWNDGAVEVVLIDVELERLLDDIGEEAVCKHFGLVKPHHEEDSYR